MITIDELKVQLDNKSRLLGVDMGTKRIGVSICDENRKIATPYETINFTNIKNLSLRFKEIILENKIKGIIFGLPVNMDGTEGPSSQSVKDKIKLIYKGSGYILVDGNLSENDYIITTRIPENLNNQKIKILN